MDSNLEYSAPGKSSVRVICTSSTWHTILSEILSLCPQSCMMVSRLRTKLFFVLHKLDGKTALIEIYPKPTGGRLLGSAHP